MNEEQLKLIDQEVLDSLKEVIGDKVNHIVGVYLEDVPKNIQSMKVALVQQDFETVGRFAHSLKSSSANVGAMRLSQLAESIEQSIKQRTMDSGQISSAVTALDSIFVQTRPILINYIG